MNILVVIEYTPECGRCAAAEKVLREICDKLGIPLVFRRVGSEGRVQNERFHYSMSPSVKTFTKEFVQTLGDREVEKIVDELEKVGIKPQRLLSTPVIRIIFESYRGGREIIVRGFPLDKDDIKKAYINLYRLLYRIVEGSR